MSNTSLGKAEKGSKYWMQLVPGTELKQEFDKAVNDEVTWLSPLEGEDYREYELRETPICKALGITDSKSAFDFWPHRQPQWDGIAVSEKTGTLYLVEAKAHTKEMESICRAGEVSRRLIEQAMQYIHDTYYNKANYLLWTECFYQLGNRLTYLKKMQEMKLEKYPNVKLVLLNFVNDRKYKPTSLAEWEAHYKAVMPDMTGMDDIPEDVEIVYIDVENR